MLKKIFTRPIYFIFLFFSLFFYSSLVVADTVVYSCASNQTNVCTQTISVAQHITSINVMADAQINYDGGNPDGRVDVTVCGADADGGNRLCINTNFGSYLQTAFNESFSAPSGSNWKRITITIYSASLTGSAYGPSTYVTATANTVPDTTTPPTPLGTICAQVYGAPASQFTFTDPNGTSNLYFNSKCTDDIAGTWTIGNIPTLSGYDGPYLKAPGTSQTVDIGYSQTVGNEGWIGWDILYVQKKYRCSGGGSCIQDNVYGDTTSSNCNNSCIAPPSVPTASISASPTSVTSGGSSTVTWSSTNATSCSVTPGGWTGTSGSQSTGALSTNTTYTVSCTGSGGNVSSSATVAVTSASAPVVTISASPTSVASGGSSTLTWSSTNSPTSCTASNGWSGAKAASGSQSTGSLSSNTTYTLSCTNASGSGSSSATVTVSGVPVSVTGSCGTANKTYASGVTSFGSDTFCTTGTASPPSPAFPSQGGSTNWSCLGSGGGANASCNATRTVSGYSVTVTPATGGIVKSVDNILNCGSTCSSPYAQNSTVTLQAYPASSYWKFNGWSGDCSGTGLCVLVVNGAKSVTASFVLRSFDYREF